MKLHMTALMTLFATGATANAARADVPIACPTQPNANLAILHIDQYTHGAGRTDTIYIGNYDFFGGRPVGACVTHPDGSFSFHAVLDTEHPILGFLPKPMNALCFSNDNDTVTVVTAPRAAPEVHCNVPMSALNYNGGELQLFGLGGSDVLTGGAGADALFGGQETSGLTRAGDTMTDGAINDLAPGRMYGEQGDDWLTGSKGNTELRGGDGVDGLWDYGGTDSFNAGAGSDCCVASKDPAFDAISCGDDGELGDTYSSVMPKPATCELPNPLCGFRSNNTPIGCGR